MYIVKLTPQQLSTLSLILTYGFADMNYCRDVDSEMMQLVAADYFKIKEAILNAEVKTE